MTARPDQPAERPDFPPGGGGGGGARPFILGIAGGIGSGKSAVAREFAKLGCVAVDFDALAGAALQRSDVRRTLIEWWGPGILTPTAPASENRTDSLDAQVDRSAVARIVFANPAERRRLEALIHALVYTSRAQALAEATARPRGGSVPGVVFDAPVLFEAGLDRECDAVVFVEADRATRLERVRASRGWDEAELERREQAQWPLDRKRGLCRFVIRNPIGILDLGEQARAVFAILRACSGASQA